MSTFTVTIVISGVSGTVVPPEHDDGAIASRRLARRRTLRAATERHVNYMLKKTEPTAEKSGFYREQVPGLSLIGDIGDEGRGCWSLGGRAFVVAGNALFEVFADWTAQWRGQLQTVTGRVDFAQGLFSLVLVDGPNGYILKLEDNAFGQITDPDFYGSERVSFLDGKFIFVKPDSQMFYWSSGIDAAAQYDALDFASAESSPDKIVGHIVDHREIWFMGENGGEVWNPAPALDQVYARNNGASIEVGNVAVHSLQQVDNSIAWLGHDRRGQGIVWLAGGSGGYTPVRISTNEVEDALASIGDLSGAYAFVYQDAGQTFYCLQIPGAQTTWCWDASTRKWHERAEYLDSSLTPWRVTAHMYAFGTHVVIDADGKLYELDPFEYTYAGNPLYREWTTPHAAVPDRKRVMFDSLRLDITMGNTSSGISPQIELRYSNDGGETWSAWMPRSTGKIGEFGKPVKWDRLGQGRDRVWQIRSTDDAKVSIIGMAVKSKGEKS